MSHTTGSDKTPSALAPATLKILSLCFALGAPLLAFCGMLFLLHYDLDTFAPASPNDEVVYYLQVQSYVEHGLSGGRFGVSESPAPLAWLRTGVHGPVYPVLYGTLGRLFGHSYTSGLWYHVMMLTTAVALYVALLRPDAGHLALLASIVLTYWPSYRSMFSWMQEPLHFAVAIVVAGGFGAILSERAYTRRYPFRIAAVALLAGASMLRVSWALMLPPLLVSFRSKRTWTTFLFALIWGLGGVATLIAMFWMICAPYPGVSSAFLFNKLLTGEIGIWALWPQVVMNLQGFSEYRYSLFGAIMMAEHFAALTALVAGTVWLLVRGFYRPTNQQASGSLRNWANQGDRLSTGQSKLLVTSADSDRRLQAWIWLNAYNLAVVTAATILVYYVGYNGGYRVFSVHFLLSLLLAATAPLKWIRSIPIFIVGIHVVVLPFAVEQLHTDYELSFTNRMRADRFRLAVTKVLPFDVVSDRDGWENTVLTDRVPVYFAGLPAVGLEGYFDPQRLAAGVKSGYVIVTPEAVNAYKLPFEPLMYIPGGDGFGPSQGPAILYRNREPAPP